MRPPLDGALVVTQLFGGNPKAEAYTTADGIAVVGHTGVDFAAQVGQDVYPAWFGFVEIRDTRPFGFGLHALIHREDGAYALYGHLSAVGVPNGAPVVPHHPFASAGSTGFSSGPHVHFEIHSHALASENRRNGYNGAVDPLPILDNDVVGRLDLTNTNL